MFEVTYYHIREEKWYTHKFFTRNGAFLCAEFHYKRSEVGAVEIWQGDEQIAAAVAGQGIVEL